MLSVLLSTLCPPAPQKSLTFWRYTNEIIIIIIIIITTAARQPTCSWHLAALAKSPVVRYTCRRLRPAFIFILWHIKYIDEVLLLLCMLG